MGCSRGYDRCYGLEGTVNLPNGGRAKTGSFPLALRGDARFGDLVPHDGSGVVTLTRPETGSGYGAA